MEYFNGFNNQDNIVLMFVGCGEYDLLYIKFSKLE